MDLTQHFIKELTEHNLWERTFELKRGDLLCKAGDHDENLYWIQEGTIHIYQILENEDHSIRFGYQQNLIVALDSFMSHSSTVYYMEALKACKISSIPKRALLDHFGEHTKGLKLWMTMLEGLILQQMEREVDLMTSSPKERYDRVLKRSPQLFQEIPLKYIASYLRMTPETLSRIRADVNS